MILLTLKKVIKYTKENGLLAAIFQIKATLFGGLNPFARKSVVNSYKDLFGDKFSFSNADKNVFHKSINWFIPPVGKGSGGHLNIFRFIKNLEALGYESNIVIVGASNLLSSKYAKSNIEKWFFALKAKVFVGIEEIPQCYFAIATSWPTAYYVNRFQGCNKKCYFVQDFEPWFYPSGTESVLAENTYKFNFFGITAGDWLAKKLNSEFGMETAAVGFSFEKNLYQPLPFAKKNDGKKRVFFYSRPPTPRRAFELGILVLDQLCKSLPNIEIIFAGWDLSEYSIPFAHQDAGLVALDKLAYIYCQCDVALVLSLSNVSLLPLELMACGVPVVSNNGPYTEWLLNKDICILADQNIDSLQHALIEVLTNEKLAIHLSEKAYEFSQTTDWHLEALKFSHILDGIRSE